jgi:hypothetical protein
MSNKEFSALARSFGAFYEKGAWRFPTVAAKQAFEQVLKRTA